MNTLSQNSMGQNSMKGWIVCLSASLFFFYIFIQMLMFNAIGQDLMTTLQLTSTKFGTLFSAYFWGNVIFLFPAGLMLDRFSTKKIILSTMMLVVIGTFLFSFSNSITVAFLSRLLIGIGGAFALLVGLRLAARWFTPSHMALVSGTIITMGFLGGVVGQTPLALLEGAVGWRHALQLDALFGLFLIFVMWLTIQDYPEGYKHEMSKEEVMSLSFLVFSIKKAVSNPQNWLFGLYTCLLNLPIFILGGVFGVRYLQQAQTLSLENATYVTSMLLIGAMIGSPVLGYISDKWGARKPPMILGAIISIVLMLLIMYVPHLNLLSLLMLFLGLGFITSAQVIGYPAIAESNPSNIVGASLSIGSTLIMAGGTIPSSLFGWLLDLHWNKQMLYGIPLHSLADYHRALWLMPIAFVLGLLAVLIAKETHCHSKYQ
ncbi:MAG: MFS transporter [Pseudomonadota bacterium]|nr:MFS transporter [Gammaproteobacteria bacterium]MBU1558632.1 MFS transporter [Gammaproteobacteria bacterium]MBU1926949.1 MFS transporter [Gammaproteobacteria bacterium]MBU2545704.1 MFS transporter [Gammaproteobacteria bacterium]